MQQELKNHYYILLSGYRGKYYWLASVVQGDGKLSEVQDAVPVVSGNCIF
jgi:hypothetical protein